MPQVFKNSVISFYLLKNQCKPVKSVDNKKMLYIYKINLTCYIYSV